MARFVAVRLAGLVGVLIVMIAVIFLLRQVVPGDPARALMGPTAPQEVVDAKRVELGLDDPVTVQFRRYVGELARGDLGESNRTRNPVTSDLADFVFASVELMGFALVAGVVMGMAFAIAQHLVRRAGPARFGLIAAASSPIFLTALVLLLIFWFRLGWLPGSGRIDGVPPDGPMGLYTIDAIVMGQPAMFFDALRHLLLPGVTLALPVAVAVGRTLHSSLVDVMRRDHIRTARSKGLHERQVLMRHALRNASTPVMAMVGLQVGLLFANLLIIEQIFAWPGLGLYTVQSLARSDLPAVLGVALVFGAAYVVINALVDVAQAWADPRVSLS